MIFRLCFIVVIIGVFVSSTAFSAETFVLNNHDTRTVNTDLSASSQGMLYDESILSIQANGYVGEVTSFNNSDVFVYDGGIGDLSTFDASVTTITGGYVSDLYSAGSSNVQLSDGTVYDLFLDESSSASISGGTVASYLGCYGQSQLEITGGSIDYIDAEETSEVTFHGYNWSYDGDLWIDGTQLKGTAGTLYGYWLGDDTQWSIEIDIYDNAIINLLGNGSQPPVVPVPAALTLGMIGVSVLLLKRRIGTL
jgi:hypothetical protein